MAESTTYKSSKRYFFVFLTILLFVMGALGASTFRTLETSPAAQSQKVAVADEPESPRNAPSSSTP